VAIHAEMQRYRLCADLSLDFLSRAEVANYLTQRFSNSQFEPVFIDWLLDITDGNALFVSEFVNLLLHEKLLTPKGQLTGDLSQITPPTNVEAVIRARLSYLDREARDMLAYGSVEGEQFTTLLLSRLLDLKPLSLISRLRTIEETHHLIASLGQQTVYAQKTTVYCFVHTLIHRTLYNLLEVEERAEINRLFLELRGEIYAQADEATQAQLAPELMAHAAAAQDYLAEARYALAAAEAAVKNHAHAEVLKHCTIGLQALDKIVEPTAEVKTLRIDLLLRRGQTEDFTGARQQAAETCRQAEDLARAQGDGARVSKILNYLGWVWQSLGDLDRGINCYKESVSVAEQVRDKINLARAYEGLGSIYWYQGDDDQALEWSQKALAIVEELGVKVGLAASACNIIALIYSGQEDYDRALESYQQAIAISEELGHKAMLGWLYPGVGSIYARRGDYDKALALYQQALTICQEVGWKRGEAHVSNYFSGIYLNRGDYDQALSWRKRSIAMWEKLDGDQILKAWAYNGLGNVYSKMSNFDQALEAYHKSLALFEEVEYKRGLAKNYNNIGAIYENQGRHDQALGWYQKALLIHEKLGNAKEIAETRDRIAAVQTELEKHQSQDQGGRRSRRKRLRLKPSA
jgi:tetratricopeptide (TPR) repeat protein